MELILTIITLSGLVVFFITWFLVIISAFRHHLITGIIAIIPILSFSILPSIWNKSSKSIITSMIAALIVLSTWFISKNENFNPLDLNNITQAPTKTQYEASGSKKIPLLSSISQSNTHFLSPKKTALPRKALYYLMFKSIERKHWDHLKDSLIRITFADETTLEGRVANILPDRLVIKYYINKQSKLVETSTQRIVQLEKLIKQPSI